MRMARQESKQDKNARQIRKTGTQNKNGPSHQSAVVAARDDQTHF